MHSIAGDSTKTRVLYALRGAGSGTAHDVAAALEISVPAARQHLLDLKNEGLLDAKVQRVNQRGRPQHVFRVSSKGEQHFPKRYAQLCTDILEHIEQVYGVGAVLSVLHSRNQTLLLQWQPRVQGSLEQRLMALLEILNELGYQASLQRLEGIWVLSQGNSPHLEVALEAVYESEADLYRQLLQAKVSRDTQTSPSVCCYLIEPVLPDN